MAEPSLIIEDGMASSDFIKSLFADQSNLEKAIRDTCHRIEPGVDPLIVLSELSPKNRREILGRIMALNPLMVQQDKFKSCYGGVSTYDNERKITLTMTTKYLPEKETTEFAVDVPMDDDRLYIDDQYLRTKLVMETLPQSVIDEYVANPPGGLAAFNPDNIRYRWCAKPGIRFIQDITLKSDITSLQSFTQNIMLFIDKEYIPDHSKKLWNALIGHDIGQIFDVVYPDTACVESRKIKIGPQTPKLIPEPLDMFIPLFYDYNIDPKLHLNTGVFKEGSISFAGHVAPANYMAIAEYYDDAIGVYPLQVPKVSIEQFNLIGSYTKLTEYLHALSIYQPWSRVIRVIREEKHTLFDLDDETKVTTKSITEVITACIRPPSYEKDFDLWTFFHQVEPSYAQVPIVINDALTGLPSVLAIGRATHYKPVPVLAKIGLESEEVIIKELLHPFYYSTLMSFKDGYRCTKYKPDVFTGLYHLRVNEQYPYKQFSALLNLAALDNTKVLMEFLPGMVDNQNLLAEKWEVIYFLHTLNVFKSYDRSMGLGYSK
jgi:hypothetical protein